MNLKQLEVFVAVAETASFSKGAEASLLTQSTVSQHIGSLEGELGVRLFDRTGRGALLTEAGRLLLQHARRLQADLQGLKQAVTRFHGLDQARLALGASNIPGTYLIPQTLPALAARHPGITLSLRHGDSREVLERLHREEIELGLVGSRFAVDGVDFTPLGPDLLQLVVAPGHPWCGREAIAPAELRETPLLLREPGSGSGKALCEALASVGLDVEQLQVRAWLGSNEAIKEGVAAGVGVSFVSERSILRERERGELQPVRVTGLQVRRHFFLVNRSGRELSPAAKVVRDLLLELYGEPVPGAGA